MVSQVEVADNTWFATGTTDDAICIKDEIKKSNICY